ncbi:MAG: magnesium transporter [Gemmatimonadota bacterium]|nr:magnesium transporter [Gemmatimonadota bacterium]
MTPSHANEERALAALLAPDILALLDEAPGDVAAETEELHPANLADVAAELPPERVPEFLRALPASRAADVLEYMQEELRTGVFEALTTEQAAVLVSEMTPDDRADVLEEMDGERADEILSGISSEARRDTEALLAHAPESAGGLMTTEFVSVSEDLTVEDALEAVRAVARAGRREAMYAIYATNREGRLHGVLSLRELLAAPPGAAVADVSWTDVVHVPPTADREEVARITSKYDLVAVPVVDEATGRIVGVVTVDDVIDAMVEEQTEAVQRLGAVEPLEMPYMQIGFAAMLRKRAGWLCILLLGEMLTVSAMGRFASEIERAVVLAAFLPLIISSGGNSGSQATSLIIRAMALNEVRLSDWWRVALRELPSGLALGAILAAIGYFRVILWQTLGWDDYGGHATLVGLSIAATLVCVVTLGTLAGSMLPFLLRRAGFDPASASAPLVATLLDVTGVTIYFAIAVFILSGTLL